MDHLMNKVDFPVEIFGVITPIELVWRAHGKSWQIDLVDIRRIFDIKEGPEPFLHDSRP
jgi:hypothetical protein